MKTQLLSLAMVIIMAGGLWGQNPKKRERIAAMKIAFITQELQLSPEESQKFWPLYNEYQRELEKYKPAPSKRPDVDNISDAEAEAMLQSMMQKESQMLEIKKRYIEKALTILPAQKVLKLFVAERKFKRQLIKQFARKKKRRM